MILRHINNLFIAECSYVEKDTAKAAGFKFCSGRCDLKFKCQHCAEISPASAGPAWWTDKPELAARLAAYADEPTRELLESASSRQALSAASDTDYVPPAPVGLEFRPFQRAGIEYVLDVWSRYKGALIADEMGLGKTVQALGLINADPSIRRVLILCPKSLQINWLREADRWLLPKQEPWRCYVAENTAPIPEQANLVICNYDKLVGKPGSVVGPSLVAHGKWDLIVYDESHYLKNPDAQRTDVSLTGLPPSARRLLFLTGTPIENKPVEIQPIVSACAPEEFSFWPFVKRYCDAHEEWVGYARKKRVWKFDGHSNLEELNARLRGTIMVRRKKSDVLKDLPAKVRQVVELPCDDVERLIAEETKTFAGEEAAVMRAFEKAEGAIGDTREFSAAVADLSSKVEAAFGELSKIRHELGRAKVEPALEWLTAALDGSDEKLIVFAHHHDVLDALREGLADYGPLQVDGRVDSADRQNAVDLFQNDPSYRVFIGQTSAAGVGLTLTAASTVVFVESDWVPGKLSQAEDRAHRIGQTKSVNVVHLVFDGSLDARMLKVVLEKQAVQDAALDAEIELTAPELDGASATGPLEGASVVKQYPKATDEERRAAREALRFLSERCDGAVKEDGAGFSKFDARLGKSLAARPVAFTDGQVVIAKKLAKKYQRQLPDHLKEILLGGAS